MATRADSQPHLQRAPARAETGAWARSPRTGTGARERGRTGFGPARRKLGSDEPDQRLLALARRGDERAFQAIVERYRPLLLAHSRRIAGEGAQDAVQQSFITAWGALRRGCDVRELRPWLYTIARHEALRVLRAEDTRYEELPETFAGGLSPSEQVEQSAHTREILTALAALPELERDALVWTSVHGHSGRDAAHALGVGEGTVRQLVFRARARMRAAAHACIPPIAFPRLLAFFGRRARRTHALAAHAVTGMGSPEAIGPLTKAAAVAGAGVLLAAPVAVVRLAEDHGAARSSARASLQTTGAPAPTAAPAPALNRPGASRAPAPVRNASAPLARRQPRAAGLVSARATDRAAAAAPDQGGPGTSATPAAHAGAPPGAGRRNPGAGGGPPSALVKSTSALTEHARSSVGERVGSSATQIVQSTAQSAEGAVNGAVTRVAELVQKAPPPETPRVQGVP